MKNLKTILFCIAIGSMQLAYDIVSWPSFVADSDLKVSAYFHDRYEAMMQHQDEQAHPDMMRVAALEDVLNKAPMDVCKGSKACDLVLTKGMQR